MLPQHLLHLHPHTHPLHPADPYDHSSPFSVDEDPTIDDEHYAPQESEDPSDLHLTHTHVVDDDTTAPPVSSIQSVAAVFERGPLPDVLALLPEISSLASTCPDGLEACVLPSLCRALPAWPADLQLPAGEQLYQCATHPNISFSLAKSVALCAIQVAVRTSTSNVTTLMPQLLFTYGNVLLHSLAATSWSHAHCIRILALVDHYASMDHMPGASLLAVKVLRGLCASHDPPPPLLSSALLPRLWNLLAVDILRTSLSTGFGRDEGRGRHLSRVGVDLSSDELILVRAHVIAALCGLTPQFSPRKLLDKLWPAVLSLWSNDREGYGRVVILPAVTRMLQMESSGNFDNGDSLDSGDKSFSSVTDSLTKQKQKNFNNSGISSSISRNNKNNDNNTINSSSSVTVPNNTETTTTSTTNTSTSTSGSSSSSSASSTPAYILSGSSCSDGCNLMTLINNICSWVLSTTSTRRQPVNITLLPEGVYACVLETAIHLPTLLSIASRCGATHWSRDGVRAFCALATADDVAVRESSARGLPSVASACRSRAACATLARTVGALARDRDTRVRIALSSSFHLLPSTVSSPPVLRRLLGDADRRVTAALIPGLAASLHAITPKNSLMHHHSQQMQQQKQHLNTINQSSGSGNLPIVDVKVGPCLMDFACAPSWRTRQAVAEQIGEAARVFACSARARDEVIILLRSLFRDSAASVRLTAGIALIKVIRQIRVAGPRHRELNVFFSEFSQTAASCNARISGVEVLYAAADLFSSRAFREHGFARQLLLLARDPVSNVRLKVARGLHNVAPACKGLHEFEAVVDMLRKDSDPDVRTAISGFTTRVSKLSSSKRAAKKDARKLDFERWLYNDNFVLASRHTDNIRRVVTGKGTHVVVNGGKRDFIGKSCEPYVKGACVKKGVAAMEMEIGRTVAARELGKSLRMRERTKAKAERFVRRQTQIGKEDQTASATVELDTADESKGRIELVNTVNVDRQTDIKSSTTNTELKSATWRDEMKGMNSTGRVLRTGSKRRTNVITESIGHTNDKWNGISAAFGRVRGLFSRSRRRSRLSSRAGVSGVGDSNERVESRDRGGEGSYSYGYGRMGLAPSFDMVQSEDMNDERSRSLGGAGAGADDLSVSELGDTDVDVEEPVSLPTEFGSDTDMSDHIKEPASLPLHGFACDDARSSPVSVTSLED